MVAREYRAAERGAGFFALAFGVGEFFLCHGFAALVGVVGAVEGGEALDVYGGPCVFALEQFVDFALGCGAAVDCVCVCFFAVADSSSCCSYGFLC